MDRPSHSKTLTEIAAEADISLSTVSKVLNGRGDVAAETRQRVSGLLRRHGYRPAAQRGFGVIDLLIGELHSPWAAELVSGSVKAAGRDGMSVVVSTLGSGRELAEWRRATNNRGTDGVLIVGNLSRETILHVLAGTNTPTVVIDPNEEPDASFLRSVGTTNHQGGALAARHLLEFGHRRIAVLAGPSDVWACRARADGVVTELAQAGFPLDRRFHRHGELNPAAGRRVAAELLSEPDPPTAIIAANDGQAFGVLQALTERGLRAPDHLSVIGYDDVPVATWSAPPLTTVRQPLAAMAGAAYRMLGLGADGGFGEVRHLEIAASLVVRDSTGPPRLGRWET
jgi:DNA-binding LacI/PurR family transcriptional regulator